MKCNFLSNSSATGQARFELNEPYNNDDIGFLGDKASRRSEKEETKHTIRLERPSDLSLDYTTPEELELR